MTKEKKKQLLWWGFATVATGVVALPLAWLMFMPIFKVLKPKKEERRKLQ